MQRTKDELRQLQSLPLETKIQMSQQRIKEWYDAHDGMVYVSFSGGKDSTVLKHLVENTPGIRERERERVLYRAFFAIQDWSIRKFDDLQYHSLTSL